MIIESIRLKNIRSYGSGPSGNGVTIRLNSGINRICGKNGSGKSSMIEAIGYALFNAKPEYKAQFTEKTYFLRSGEQEGEIEIKLSHNDQHYRIERHLGNSKSVDKAIKSSDDFIEAEGTKAVDDLLCRLFDVKNTASLSQIFSKSIGIRQGRLTMAFDNTTASLKSHFDGLLNIEIFRQCHKKLHPVWKIFDDQLRAIESDIPRLEERIKERTPFVSQHNDLKQKKSVIDKTYTEAKTAGDEIKKELLLLKNKEVSIHELEKKCNEHKQKIELANNNNANIEQQLLQIKAAKETLQINEKAHQQWISADNEIEKLQKLRQDLSSIDKKRQKTKEELSVTQSKIKESSNVTDALISKADKLSLENDFIKNKLILDRKSLTLSKEALEYLDVKASETNAAYISLSNFNQSIQQMVTSHEAICGKILIQKEFLSEPLNQRFAESRASHKTSTEECNKAESQLLLAKEKVANNKTQLDQISGGVCPFLKESCKQFDSNKITEELNEYTGQIEILEKIWNESVIKEQHDQRMKNELESAFNNQSKEAAVTKQYIDQLIEEIQGKAKWDDPSGDKALKENLPNRVFEYPCFSFNRLSDCLVINEVAYDFNPQIVSEYLDEFKKHTSKFNEIHQQLKQPVVDLLKQKDDASLVLAGESKRIELEETRLKENESSLATLRSEYKENERSKAILQSKLETLTEENKSLEERLKEFPLIDDRISKEQDIRESTSKGYKLYIENETLVKNEETLLEDSKIIKRAQSDLAASLKQHSSELEVQAKTFSKEELEKTESSKNESLLKINNLKRDVEQLIEQINEADIKLKELKEAQSFLAILLKQKNSIHASLTITAKARSILRDAAPELAKCLCETVTQSAQSIFNNLHHDPSSIHWDSDNYNLSVQTMTGLHRFPALSGGEQTKLALSMTLGIIQEFINCKFCIFDEPTYGIDADSRNKLADSILLIQSICKFEQLILVSHDEAFDGKIDNVIELQKNPLSGTEVVETLI